MTEQMVPRVTFSGECIGGPEDGRFMEWSMSRKSYVEFPSLGPAPRLGESHVSVRTIGEYRYSSGGGGSWIWEAAK